MVKNIKKIINFFMLKSLEILNLYGKIFSNSKFMVTSLENHKFIYSKIFTNSHIYMVYDKIFTDRYIYFVYSP